MWTERDEREAAREKVTITLPTVLLEKVRKLSWVEDRTIGSVVARALRLYFETIEGRETVHR